MRTPNELKKHIQTQARNYSGHVPTKGEIGSMVGALNTYLGGDDHRYRVVAWLFDKPGPTSSKSLDLGQICALLEWVNLAHSEESGKWEVSDTFEIECALVLTEALRVFPPPEAEQGMVEDAVVHLGAQVSHITEGPSDLFRKAKRRGSEPPVNF